MPDIMVMQDNEQYLEAYEAETNCKNEVGKSTQQSNGSYPRKDTKRRTTNGGRC